MSNTTRTIRMVIADDHEISRLGIRRLLASAPEIEVVAEASNGNQAIEEVRAAKPDVVLLDVYMPESTGIDAAKAIKNDSHKCHVIMLSSVDDSNAVHQALYTGADGYLTKDVSAPELISAIRSVLQGQRVFSRRILNMLDGEIQSPEEASGSEGKPAVSLTKREEQIVSLVAKGHTSQEIAKKLYISPRTVETHRARIMVKLGVNNTAGLVRFALLHSTYFDSKVELPEE
ncbi:MAG: response regulator transcription factor [Bacteroidetes bacterium]|nr:MAG: response regulator transcription factor [Bacteroidota bacterium]MBZ0194530.1 response regulator transcription factor [Candidatus Kapabacteria bacterium]